MKKTKTKIVVIRHINYDVTYGIKSYYFKTNDNVKVNDIVLLDTKYGVAIGVVKEIMNSISELLLDENFHHIFSQYEIRECKLFPDLKNIELKEDENLPF